MMGKGSFGRPSILVLAESVLVDDGGIASFVIKARLETMSVQHCGQLVRSAHGDKRFSDKPLQCY